MSKLGDMFCKVMQLKRITDGGLGAEPPAAGDHGGLEAKTPAAGRFFEKLAILLRLDHKSHKFRAIWKPSKILNAF